MIVVPCPHKTMNAIHTFFIKDTVFSKRSNPSKQILQHPGEGSKTDQRLNKKPTQRMLTTNKSHHNITCDNAFKKQSTKYRLKKDRRKTSKISYQRIITAPIQTFKEILGAQCCTKATPQLSQHKFNSTTMAHFKDAVHHRHQKDRRIHSRTCRWKFLRKAGIFGISLTRAIHTNLYLSLC